MEKTIIAHPSKTYTREEVRMKISYCVAELTAHPKMTAKEMKGIQDKVDQWIKDNLAN